MRGLQSGRGLSKVLFLWEACEMRIWHDWQSKGPELSLNWTLYFLCKFQMILILGSFLLMSE